MGNDERSKKGLQKYRMERFRNEARTPGSGSTTPVPPGSSYTTGSRLQRKPSGASDISAASKKKAQTPTDPRAPFRL
ncbi:hypothetical protein RUM43_012742 [Polyplax serrata]|uniref:Uncharacterized protein n=1 Tax=Polyplax serrata TaxID=468196 RepID=A0AAN8S6H4_POLSC